MRHWTRASRVGWFGISDCESHVAVARQAHGAGMRTWITRSPARIGKQDMTSSPGTSWSYGPAERWGRPCVESIARSTAGTVTLKPQLGIGSGGLGCGPNHARGGEAGDGGPRIRVPRAPARVRT